MDAKKATIVVGTGCRRGGGGGNGGRALCYDVAESILRQGMLVGFKKNICSLGGFTNTESRFLLVF